MNKIALKNKKILVTGAAGFIGSNLVIELLKSFDGIKVVGLDNVNNYYDPAIKEYRLKQIEERGGDFTFVKGNLADSKLIQDTFTKYQPDIVVNLAAQAGVRYSIYLLHNIITKNCRAKWRILHLQNGENCRGYSDYQAMKNPLQT